MSKINDNDLLKIAQQISFWEKLKSSPSRWVGEKLFSEFKVKMDELRTIDSEIRKIALGNNSSGISIKKLLEAINYSYDKNKFVDTMYYMYLVNDILVEIIISGQEKVKQLRDIPQFYDPDADPASFPGSPSVDLEYFGKTTDQNKKPEQTEEQKKVEAQLLQSIYKGIVGDPFQKAFAREIAKRKNGIGAAVRKTDGMITNMLGMFDRMAVSMRKGEIEQWIFEFERIANTQPQYKLLLDKVYQGYVKDLVEKAREMRSEKSLGDNTAGLEKKVNQSLSQQAESQNKKLQQKPEGQGSLEQKSNIIADPSITDVDKPELKNIETRPNSSEVTVDPKETTEEAVSETEVEEALNSGEVIDVTDDSDVELTPDFIESSAEKIINQSEDVTNLQEEDTEAADSINSLNPKDIEILVSSAVAVIENNLENGDGVLNSKDELIAIVDNSQLVVKLSGEGEFDRLSINIDKLHQVLAYIKSIGDLRAPTEKVTVLKEVAKKVQRRTKKLPSKEKRELLNPNHIHALPATQQSTQLATTPTSATERPSIVDVVEESKPAKPAKPETGVKKEESKVSVETSSEYQDVKDWNINKDGKVFGKVPTESKAKVLGIVSSYDNGKVIIAGKKYNLVNFKSLRNGIFKNEDDAVKFLNLPKEKRNTSKLVSEYLRDLSSEVQTKQDKPASTPEKSETTQQKVNEKKPEEKKQAPKSDDEGSFTSIPSENYNIIISGSFIEETKDTNYSKQQASQTGSVESFDDSNLVLIAYDKNLKLPGDSIEDLEKGLSSIFDRPVQLALFDDIGRVIKRMKEDDTKYLLARNILDSSSLIINKRDAKQVDPALESLTGKTISGLSEEEAKQIGQEYISRMTPNIYKKLEDEYSDEKPVVASKVDIEFIKIAKSIFKQKLSCAENNYEKALACLDYSNMIDEYDSELSTKLILKAKELLDE